MLYPFPGASVVDIRNHLPELSLRDELEWLSARHTRRGASGLDGTKNCPALPGGRFGRLRDIGFDHTHSIGRIGALVERVASAVMVSSLYEWPIPHPVRPVGVGAESLVPVNLVICEVSFKEDDLRLSLERQDMR